MIAVKAKIKSTRNGAKADMVGAGNAFLRVSGAGAVTFAPRGRAQERAALDGAKCL